MFGIGLLASLQARLIAAAIVALTIFTAGYRTCAVIRDAAHAKELQAEIDAKMAWIEWGEKQSEKLEKQLAALRRKNQNTTQKVSNEITSNDVYRALLPASGLSLYNQAIQGGEATSKPDTEMRAAPHIKAAGNSR